MDTKFDRTLWDTFGLYDRLLNSFADARASANAATTGLPLSPLVGLSVEGFQLFRPVADWTAADTAFIEERVRGELSSEALGWYEDDAPAIAAFSCLALGSLLGKLTNGDINEEGFFLGEAHLPGFVSLNDEQICSEYR